MSLASLDPSILVTSVLQGVRPTLPDSCPQMLRDLIQCCWAPDPADRPEFKAIVSELDNHVWAGKRQRKDTMAEDMSLLLPPMLPSSGRSSTGRTRARKTFATDPGAGAGAGREAEPGSLAAPRAVRGQAKKQALDGASADHIH